MPRKLLIIAAMGYLAIAGVGQVHYHEYGDGERPLLAFHGYGMTGRQFEVLKRSILPNYRVYGFDHFFHGESRLTETSENAILEGMPRAAVRSYLEEWFLQHGRRPVSLMAYSIGASFALVLLEEFPDMIEEIILMAPDGISNFKGFRFLTEHFAGRWLFRRAARSQWIVPLLLRTLKMTGMIDESLQRIASNEVDTAKKRLDVYYTLNCIRRVRPDLQKAAAIINGRNIRCTLVFGRDDKLFPMSSAAAFIGMLTNPGLHEVPLGHWLVVTALDDYLVNCNNDNRPEKPNPY